MQIQNILEITGVGIAAVAALGGIVVVVAYFISSYSQGSRQQKTEVLASADQLTVFWKDQVSGFKDMVAAQTEKIRMLSVEIGELRGQLNAEKKQNEEFKAIFQGRNPEMDGFMKTMLGVSEQTQKFMADNVQFQKDQHENMVQIKNFMELINRQMSKPDKDLEIKATVTKK